MHHTIMLFRFSDSSPQECIGIEMWLAQTCPAAPLCMTMQGGHTQLQPRVVHVPHSAMSQQAMCRLQSQTLRPSKSECVTCQIHPTYRVIHPYTHTCPASTYCLLYAHFLLTSSYYHHYRNTVCYGQQRCSIDSRTTLASGHTIELRNLLSLALGSMAKLGVLGFQGLNLWTTDLCS